MAAEYKLEGFQAQIEQYIAVALLTESPGTALRKLPGGLQLHCKSLDSVTGRVESFSMSVKYSFSLKIICFLIKSSLHPECLFCWVFCLVR